MRDVGLLLKFRLAFTVVFSAAAGYLLGAPVFVWSEFLLLTLGGFAIVGSSNAFNQIWEIERDAVMERTKNRPLPSGRMKKPEAYARLLYFLEAHYPKRGQLNLSASNLVC